MRSFAFFSSEVFAVSVCSPPDNRRVFWYGSPEVCVIYCMPFLGSFSPNGIAASAVRILCRRTQSVTFPHHPRIILALCNLFNSSFRVDPHGGNTVAGPSRSLAPCRPPEVSPRAYTANHLRQESRARHGYSVSAESSSGDCTTTNGSVVTFGLAAAFGARL